MQSRVHNKRREGEYLQYPVQVHCIKFGSWYHMLKYLTPKVVTGYYVKQFYSFYMAAVVYINDECGLDIDTRYGNQPNNSKLEIHKPLIHCNSP